MPIYAKVADPDTLDIIKGIRSRFHSRLSDVMILAIFAKSKPQKDGKPSPPPMLRKNMRVLAYVFATDSIARAFPGPDAVLVIDWHWWTDADVAKRRALIDHELTHIEFRVGKDGEVQRDEHDRPLINMRNHDYEITGFYEVAERHGVGSVELAAAQTVIDGFKKYAQLAFGFMDFKSESECVDAEAEAEVNSI